MSTCVLPPVIFLTAPWNLLSNPFHGRDIAVGPFYVCTVCGAKRVATKQSTMWTEVKTCIPDSSYSRSRHHALPVSNGVIIVGVCTELQKSAGHGAIQSPTMGHAWALCVLPKGVLFRLFSKCALQWSRAHLTTYTITMYILPTCTARTSANHAHTLASTGTAPPCACKGSAHDPTRSAPKPADPNPAMCGYCSNRL